MRWHDLIITRRECKKEITGARYEGYLVIGLSVVQYEYQYIFSQYSCLVAGVELG